MASNRSITAEEALRGARLVLDNGAALLDDALLLYEAGRFPRTVTLAVLAMEEFGKLPRLLGIDRYQREGRMKEWWRDFRSHDAKASLNALITVLETENDIGWLATASSDWHRDFGLGLTRLKLRTLYVDYIAGKFTAPSEIDKVDTASDGAARPRIQVASTASTAH